MDPNVLAVGGAIVGAIFGAGSTQLFSIVKESFSYRKQQVRAINGAIAASSAICDAVLQLKSQQLNEVQSFIARENERIDEILVRSELTGSFEEIHIELNCVVLPRISPPIDELSEVLHKNLDASGNMLLYFYAIVRSFKVLEATLESYNALIGDWLKNEPVNDEDAANRFLGRYLKSGHVDTRHVDFIEQMDLSINSCAAYSYLLSEALSEKGQKLRNSFLFRKPRIGKPDFSFYRRSGDFPDETYISGLRKH